VLNVVVFVVICVVMSDVVSGLLLSRANDTRQATDTVSRAHHQWSRGSYSCHNSSHQ